MLYPKAVLHPAQRTRVYLQGGPWRFANPEELRADESIGSQGSCFCFALREAYPNITLQVVGSALKGDI